jgi:cytochrome c peroxidase
MIHQISKLGLLLALLFSVGLLGCGSGEKPEQQSDATNSETSTDTSTNADAATNGDSPSSSSDPKSMDTADTTPGENQPATDDSADTQSDPPASNVVLLGSGDLLDGIPGEGPLTVEEIKQWLADEKNHEVLSVQLPLGLDKAQLQIKGLEANPLTRAKIELGRQLYFDKRLSSDGTVACADCHHPDDGYARHTQFGVGIGGQQGGRNSPVSYNRILSELQFWDGRAASLEDQAVGPIANPIEMGNTHETCIGVLNGIAGYQLQFDKIFGELTIETVGQALASFERCLVTGPSPYDYYNEVLPYEGADVEEMKEEDPDLYATYLAAKEASEGDPMSESAKRGRALFFSEKASCSACHVGANLTDENYHNIGVSIDAEEPDEGRFAVTGDEKDRGAFKTPTIRNVALTAPYMHDGSQQTLEEVVEHYAKGGTPNPHLSDKMKKLDLTDQDKQDLVAFMQSCTGSFPSVQGGRLPE